MSWISLGSSAIIAGGSIASSAISSKKGGSSGGGGGFFQVPEFQPDKYYDPSQQILFGQGKDILAGNLNDYYAPIGEFGGDQFHKFLDSVISDTSKAVDESAIRRGVGRGGTTAAATAEAVSGISAQYGYQDYLRAIQGREGLLKLGTGDIEGVRSAGLTNQAQVNNYALQKSQIEAGMMKYGDSINMGIDEANASANSSWMDNIFGAGSSVLESLGQSNKVNMTPGDVESAVSSGKKIGSAGGTDWTSIVSTLLKGLSSSKAGA